MNKTQFCIKMITLWSEIFSSESQLKFVLISFFNLEMRNNGQLDNSGRVMVPTKFNNSRFYFMLSSY